MLWTTYFFGRNGAIGIVLWIGLVDERVEVELARARRKNASIGVASFDIDYFAERVRAAFETQRDPDLPRATISAGVTTAPAPAEIEPLIQIADSALNRAKAAGRNRTIVAQQTIAVAA